MNTLTQKRKVTLMLDAKVYEALVAKIGARGMGEYISNLVSPRLVASDIDAGYKAMAADAVYESEAKEWIEGTELLIDEENVWTF
jgi:hypothetical protein